MSVPTIPNPRLYPTLFMAKVSRRATTPEHAAKFFAAAQAKRNRRAQRKQSLMVRWFLNHVDGLRAVLSA